MMVPFFSSSRVRGLRCHSLPSEGVLSYWSSWWRWRQNDRKQEGLVSATPWEGPRVKAGFSSPTVHMKKVWLRKEKRTGPRSHRAGSGLNKTALRPTSWNNIPVPKWWIPGLRKGNTGELETSFFFPRKQRSAQAPLVFVRRTLEPTWRSTCQPNMRQFQHQ